MCNFYNASASSVLNNCNYASYANSTNYSNGWGTQYMCRGCNGNIYARNATNCGCSSCCHCNCCHNCCNCCQNSCGNNNTNSNDTATGNNGNGSFTCVTFCGNTLNGLTQNASTATTNSGCGCGYGYGCQRRQSCRRWF
ncbi:MAG: hypothetical protein E7349_06035 [Clostridiales bacterium]|nr:hypothetical protein [Clostridiales bacterium]